MHGENLIFVRVSERSAHVRAYLLTRLQADLIALDLARFRENAVYYLHRDPFVVGAGYDADVAVHVGVLHDVAHDVVEQPLQRRDVCPDLYPLDRVLEIYLEPVVYQFGGMLREQLLQQDVCVEHLEILIQPVLRSENQEVLEQFVGKILQLESLLVADRNVLHLLLARGCFAAFDDVQVSDQRRQRSPDIVRHGRDQLCVRLPGLLFLLEPLDYRVPHRVDVDSQLADLVIRERSYLRVQIAAAYLAHLMRQPDHAVRDLRVVDQQDGDEDRHADRRAQDEHDPVEMSLLIDVDVDVIVVVGKSDYPVAEVYVERVVRNAHLVILADVDVVHSARVHVALAVRDARGVVYPAAVKIDGVVVVDLQICVLVLFRPVL